MPEPTTIRVDNVRLFVVGGILDLPPRRSTFRVLGIEPDASGYAGVLQVELVCRWGWRYRARKRWQAWSYALEQWCDNDGVRALILGFAAGAILTAIIARTFWIG